MANKIDPSQMSEEEIELRLELISRARRTAAGAPPTQPPPPAVATAATPGPTPSKGSPAIVRIQGRKAKTQIEERWFSTLKICPHCGKEKNVGKDFGVIVHRGVQYAAGHCKQCRSETSAGYKKKARQNHSVNNPEKPLSRPRPGARVKKSKHNPKK